MSKKLFLCLAVAGICGASAQIRIPLPFTPVPITGQVFVVLLSGIILNGLFGGISMLFYLVLGVVGLPWFAGGQSGFGPTTGYIIGFIPASLYIGLLTERLNQRPGLLNLLGMIMPAVLIIYLFGATYLGFFMKLGFRTTLSLAVFPFIPVDLFKALVVVLIAKPLFSEKRIT
ncbi:hypothetical protein BXT86_00585 [candidate division WOR-3 bacterium 4484_100]|uniref:Biotin transporter n=1 Tax=candidate division WOR-3 bacterium 4484_100 TaxID=1936077 RepID=A0A1V4QGU2_UNCW3|nr:MAG: hypothetical protein BXT86_00585 [candidate division WOR-3 bacterium 4484_100]